MPQAAVVLAFCQGGNLCVEDCNQIAPYRVPLGEIHQFQKIRDHHGEPAVAPRPTRPGKVMPPLIVPAVKPQPGLPVHQVLHMEQELVGCLLHILGAVKQLANFG